MKGILGRKLGMTQVFTEDGTLIPVTVVEACPNVVLQKKTVENDGYEAVQLGFEDVKETRSTKGEAGHAAKANTAPKRFVKEVRDSEFADLELGAEANVGIFTAGVFFFEIEAAIGNAFMSGGLGNVYKSEIMPHAAHQEPGITDCNYRILSVDFAAACHNRLIHA